MIWKILPWSSQETRLLHSSKMAMEQHRKEELNQATDRWSWWDHLGHEILTIMVGQMAIWAEMSLGKMVALVKEI